MFQENSFREPDLGKKICIDYNKCKECGICVAECPHHKRKEGHAHIDHGHEFCDQCLHCYCVCPEEAIIVEDNENLLKPMVLEPYILLSHIMHRRSYRNFSSKKIDNKLLDQLVTSALYIPSGGNDHRFDITILTSDDSRKQLLLAIHAYYKKILKLLKNPILKMIAQRIGDPKVKATLQDESNYKKIVHAIEQLNGEDDVVFYNAPAVFFFHTDRIMPTAKEDCILSAYNVVLFSETLGLGSCFVSLSQQAVTNDKRCKDILSIPKRHRIEAVVVVGYPIHRYKRYAFRKTKVANFI